MLSDVVEGLKLPAVGLDQVAVGALESVPTKLIESLAQIDLLGPALTSGVGVMDTVTLPVTLKQPVLAAVSVRTTEVGAAAFSEAAGL